MKYLGIITRREYLNKIRNRSFVIMTFVSPLIVVIFALVIGFLTNVNNKSKAKDIVIVDESGLYTNTFENTETIQYEYLSNVSLKDAKAEVLAKSKYGLLYIPNKGDQNIAFYSEESPSLSLTSELTNAMERTLFQHNLTKKGIDKKEIDAAISIQMENFTGEKTSELDNVMKITIGGIAGYLIFMFIIIYGNMIMRSVIEEKTNRIVEIIISSVKPFELMLGKILGTSLAGLTQFAIWIVIGGVLLALAPSFFEVNTSAQAVQGAGNVSEINNIVATLYHFPFAETFVVFLLFFIGGYLLYSSLYAMIGAMVDNETDTQQFLMPILLPLILAFYVGMFSVIEEPHGTISVVFSYIPLTSPVVMLMRIPFGVAWWEVLISLVILYLTFFAVIKLASKIYRIGILMYGKKASYREVWKWLKMK